MENVSVGLLDVKRKTLLNGTIVLRDAYLVGCLVNQRIGMILIILIVDAMPVSFDQNCLHLTFNHI